MVKTLERWLKSAWLDALVILKYGTRSPDCVALPRSRHSVFIDPNDLRARKKLIRESIRSRLQRNAQFWCRARAELSPDIALDVGLNYGECLFSCDYPAETRLIGIEANRGLRPYVEQSRTAHPNGAQMEIHYALASDTHRRSSDFYVMRHWSGGSTALAEVTDVVAAEYDKVEVESVCVDELLATTIASDQLLLFKIDVEGYEPAVLRGMRGSIEAVDTAVGLIEFDTKLLDRTDDGAELFWSELQQQFRLFAFTSHRAMADVSGWTLSAAKQMFGGGDFHTDLLLVSSVESAAVDAFLSRWLSTPRRSAA